MYLNRFSWNQAMLEKPFLSVDKIRCRMDLHGARISCKVDVRLRMCEHHIAVGPRITALQLYSVRH